MIRPTTILSSSRLDAKLGVEVVLASETFQHTGSFKFRGSWQLARSVPQHHLIASSSGNFGQALAFACRQFGKRCTVVVPASSAAVKVAAIREYGGEVDFIDPAKVSRDDRVKELAAEVSDAYIASGFDDDHMIAGNSTLGRELAEKAGDVEAIIVPVSGGGLASGIVVGLREAGAAIPGIGAEPLLANHVTRSLQAGRRIVDPEESKTIADGARGTALGKKNWGILSQTLKCQLEVSEEAIGAAVRLLFYYANLKVEPTGALAVAAVLQHGGMLGLQRVCCVVTGGNVDVRTYRDLLRDQ